MRYVQHQRARSLCDIHRVFAREPKPHVVFRQKHTPETLPDFRFVVAHPKQFGQCEIGQRRIASQLNYFSFANFRIEPVALRLCALVAPNQGRTQDLIVRIQQNRTVHLPGQAHRGNV